MGEKKNKELEDNSFFFINLSISSTSIRLGAFTKRSPFLSMVRDKLLLFVLIITLGSTILSPCIFSIANTQFIGK
jgi:hypothetical protein